MQKQNICRKRSLREKRGITLIALIITIIVMLILVGVSIQIVINSNLFNTAKSAGEQTESKYEEDKTFGDNITINGKDYSNLNDYMSEIRFVGQSDGNGLKDYKIYGNSMQKGIPTPGTPIEVESVGERTNNIADLSKTLAATTTQHVTFTYDNKTGTVEYTSTPTRYDYLMLYLERDLDFKFEEGKTYYCGADVTVSGKQTTDRTTLNFGINYTGSPSTLFHVTENGTYHVGNSFVYDNQETIRLILHANVDSVEPAKVKYENIFVSEVNEYEPYGYKIPVTATNENGDSVTTNIYLDEPLRKIGNYKDYIDFETGKVVRNIGVKTFNGTESWDKYTSGSSNSYYMASSDFQIGYQTSLCDKFQNINESWKQKNVVAYSDHSTLNRKYFTILDDTITTAEEFKSWLSENPFLLTYVLATPKIQYVDLPEISTLEGNNIITIETQIEPSDVILEF